MECLQEPPKEFSVVKKYFLGKICSSAVFAEDTALEETAEEGRTFLTPLLGLLPPLATLVNVGTQVVILIALIGFVTGLKGVVDFESLFKKEEISDDWYRRGDYGPVAYQSGNFAPQLRPYNNCLISQP